MEILIPLLFILIVIGIIAFIIHNPLIFLIGIIVVYALNKIFQRKREKTFEEMSEQLNREANQNYTYTYTSSNTDPDVIDVEYTETEVKDDR